MSPKPKVMQFELPSNRDPILRRKVERRVEVLVEAAARDVLSSFHLLEAALLERWLEGER